MRYPLWVLNSVLFVLVISALLFIAFWREDIPERAEVEPEATVLPIRDGVATVDLKQIYENDLFGTYIKPVRRIEEPKYVVPLPSPPEPISVEVPQEKKPTFLDPLQATLKGIMSVSDGTKNKAIIADNVREAVYKVGDKIEDAQLIRIFKNKVIFVRSNGQQEVLYLREEDAKADPTYLVVSDWKSVVRRVAKNKYHLYLKEFKKRVKNLAHFIDILDLTTAYQKGKNLGCRVGDTEQDSLADVLGLQSGDVIISINGIPATDTRNRLAIYKKLTTMELGETILVRLQRRGQFYTLRYILSDFAIIKKPSGPGHPVTTRYVQQEQEKLLKKKEKVAPTVREIRRQERQNMLRRGRKPTKKSKR